jgi:hypothetical protein
MEKELIITKLNTGYKEPERTDDNYIMGSGQVIAKILRPDGQWVDDLPDDEVQNKNGIEPYACTNFTACNVGEILMRCLFGGIYNYSDRHSAIGSHTSPERGGNDPHLVFEFHRKNGFIDEKELPFDDSITSVEKFYTPKYLTPYFLNLGKKWLALWDLKHDWLPRNDEGFVESETIMEALKYSPLAVGVWAWAFNQQTNLFERPVGYEKQDNHECVIVGFAKGKKWLIDDSYVDIITNQKHRTIKELDWNFKFRNIKRVTISVSVSPEKQSALQNLMDQIIDLFQKISGKILGIWKK